MTSPQTTTQVANKLIPFARLAYAAAHVVTTPDYKFDPEKSASIEDIDWNRTLEFRRYLWSLGLGVAEAMDTAQRSLLGWEIASELIHRTLADAKAHRTEVAWTETIAGAGTDGISTAEPTLTQLIDEYVRQGEFIQSRGGTLMLLATPHLPRMRASESQYAEVYREVSRQLEPQLFVHWLGPMFAANLAGYFPGNSFWRIMHENAGRMRGVKLSMLDDQMEIDMRRRLRADAQIVLTGDDFNYAALVKGDASIDGEPRITISNRSFPAGDFSHALLGIFDAIAPLASDALGALSRGDIAGYDKLMNPTLSLARLIFEPPTENYKAGVVFLAYLNGHQDHFTLLGGLESARTKEHYAKVLRLAEFCGVLRDPDDARRRAEKILNH
jgi:hypothetical protein